jgi:integrase
MTQDRIDRAMDGLAPFFREYLDRKQDNNRDPKTVYNIARILGPWQDFLTGRGLDWTDATEEDLRAYLRGTGYGQGTKRQHAITICAVHEDAFKRDKIAKDPFALYEIPAAPDPDPAAKNIPIAELRRMFKKISIQITMNGNRYTRTSGATRTKALTLLYLLAFTGMRRNEIRELSWNLIDWDARTFTIVGKNKKRRTVPIHPILLEHLEQVHNGAGPRDPILKPDVAQFTDRGFHDFRKTAASSLFANDVAGETIDEIFGWAPATIRAKYYVTIQPEKLHAAMDRLYVEEGGIL